MFPRNFRSRVAYRRLKTTGLRIQDAGVALRDIGPVATSALGHALGGAAVGLLGIMGNDLALLVDVFKAHGNLFADAGFLHRNTVEGC